VKIKSIGLILITSTLLSSCFFTSTFKKYTDYVKDFDTYEDVVGEGYIKPKEFSSIPYMDGSITKTITNYDDIYEHRNTRIRLNSVGTQNLLVIPVAFSDDNLNLLPKGKDNTLIDLKNAFFGIEGNTQFESVASFYNKSSYGKLILDGDVSSWCVLEHPASYYVNLNNKEQVVKDIYNYSINWYKQNYLDIEKYYIDNDENKGVSIFLVYAHEFVDNRSDDNLFWAYALIDPNPICFASVHFMYLEGKGKVDSRTYIHELGHAFGLDDYYDKKSGATNYLGMLDMMDSSIGDHNPYSKMLLNWARPYYISNHASINIRPFTFSSDFILINPKWNYSPFDEYLLVEYYVPSGLNNKFGEYIISKPCIRIYHVDSRAAFFIKTLTYRKEGYIEQMSAPSNYYLRIGNENLSSDSNKLIETISKDGILRLETLDYEKMYHKGDIFDSTYNFNNGLKVKVSIDIKNLNNEFVSLDISSSLVA